mmetsp:Transcript_2893/g.4798  ORF Transcript_2893/g.4798 Transcript_2893/m.4798 type:complete len:568 (+) Transcript_2893:365-2068(+)
MALIQSETDVWILLYYLGLFFCVFILWGQIVGICYNQTRLKALHHESWVTTQGKTSPIMVSLFTTYLCSIIGIAVSISRIGNQMYDPIGCEYTYTLSFLLFATAKLCNYYFFLQRAQLAQGLSKLLPDIVFDKVFPYLLLTVYIFYIVMLCIFPLRGERVTSRSGSGRELCIWNEPDIEHQIIHIFSVLLDLSATAFFLYLYGKPMCDIARRAKQQPASGQIPVHTQMHEIKLRRCIVINFVCSSVSSVHTGLVALTWWNISFMSWWSQMDLVVNCLCLFAMFASNRRLCLHACCCHHRCMDIRAKTYKYADTHHQHSHDDNGHSAHHGKASNGGKTSNLEVMGRTNSNGNDKYPSMLHSMSDFPQPDAVLHDDRDPEPDDDDEAGRHTPMAHSPASMSANKPFSTASRGHRGDSVEQNNFVSEENGISYLDYLDNANSCWYYKSKLFWTWFAYYFCFCGNRSVCKCYLCLCKWRRCESRIEARKHVMRYMFGAAKKLQHKRYVTRLHNESTKRMMMAQTSSNNESNNERNEQDDGEEEATSPKQHDRQSTNVSDFDGADIAGTPID